jgi:hypothetical protein
LSTLSSRRSSRSGPARWCRTSARVCDTAFALGT